MMALHRCGLSDLEMLLKWERKRLLRLAGLAEVRMIAEGPPCKQGQRERFPFSTGLSSPQTEWMPHRTNDGPPYKPRSLKSTKTATAYLELEAGKIQRW
jgi:hypothetical protein